MSATFVEDLCQLDVTELRQLIVALCLDPKTKEFATQHLDMTAHMKSIKAQEAQVSDEESITDYDSEPSEKGDLDCWGSPPPNDSDSDAEDTPCSSENHTWEARANYSDPWAEENKSTCSLGPNSVEDVDWGFAPEPGFWFPACQRDNTLGSDDSPERSASESAWNVDSGSDFSRNVWCADCDQEFIPTSKWYDEFYGERMPCRFHTGQAELDPAKFDLEYGPQTPRSTWYNMRVYPRAYVWTCCNETVAEASPCQRRDWHTTRTW